MTEEIGSRREGEVAVSRPGWCRATRSLVGASGLWLAFVVLRRRPSGGSAIRRAPDPVPRSVFVAVPSLLLVAPGLVRLVRAPVPRRPLWLIRAAAVCALVLGQRPGRSSAGSRA